MKLILKSALFLAVGLNLAGCLGDENGESNNNPGERNQPLVNQEDEDESYEKRVFYECNGETLVDEVFNSYEDCVEYRDTHEIICAGIELPISC